MRRKRIPFADIKSLYVTHEWTLQRIADHLCVSKQALQDRLKRAGVLRPVSYVQPKIDRETCERMYVREKLSVATLAKRIRVATSAVEPSLQKYGIQKRGRGVA